MDVAQPRDEELMSRLVARHMKRRVLLGQPRQAGRDLLFVAAGFGKDRERVNRVGQVEPGQSAAVFGSQCVTRVSALQLGHGDDVARAGLGGLHLLLAAREEELAHALVAAPAHVGQVLVGLDAP